MKHKLAGFLAFTLLAACHSPLSIAHAQGTTFTYQGRLDVDGIAATGLYDFSFRVYDAVTNGLFFGGAVTVSATPVSNGLFTVALAFNPAAFDGSPRWLDIGVTTNGGGVFNSLTPRQPVTATPYAMIAGSVTGAIPLAQLPPSVVTNGASGINITGTFSGDGAGVTNVNLGLSSGGSIRPESGVFILNATLNVGSSPSAVIAADVNGDGKLDLISGNYSANTLSVLTNNGSGGFVFSSLPAVSSPESVVAADVNGDGKMDLIVANLAANTLTVLTNNGSGGFVISSSPGVGAGPFSVTTNDFNGDGKVDLICANSAANTVSVLTNNGSGGFVLSSSPAVGSGPRSVMAADLNGDGKADLICANYTANTLSVLTNNGSGGFVLASSPTVGISPVSIMVADVNGDGKMDLISANYNGGNLSVLTNNGSGGFVLASSPAVGSGPISVTAADINGDGKLDLISANFASDSLSVLINKGNGSFALTASLAVGVKPQSVVAADVNGDGKTDLISANQFVSTLSVLFNNIEFDGFFVGSGQFSTASFGSTLSQKLFLYGVDWGFGIQSGVLYSRVGTGGGFAWYDGGTHNDATYNPGAGGTIRMKLDSGGLVVNGTFVSASDRNLKQDFSEVSGRSILEKVAQLPIQTWTYKNDPGTKHLGPMAQDFYAAFAIGPDDKHITTVDESGVALAAIQGLNQKLQEQRAENIALRLRVEKLEHLLQLDERDK